MDLTTVLLFLISFIAGYAANFMVAMWRATRGPDVIPSLSEDRQEKPQPKVRSAVVHPTPKAGRTSRVVTPRLPKTDADLKRDILRSVKDRHSNG